MSRKGRFGLLLPERPVQEGPEIEEVSPNRPRSPLLRLEALLQGLDVVHGEFLDGLVPEDLPVDRLRLKPSFPVLGATAGPLLLRTWAS